MLRTVLVEQLQRLNPAVLDSVVRAEEVIARLVRVWPDIEGNLEAWEFLKGLKTVFVEAERRERSLRLLDAGRPEANTFHVTDEFGFVSGRTAIRRAFEERQLNSQQALQELTALVRDLQDAQEQRRESRLSPEAFAVAWWLRVQKGFDAEKAEVLAGAVEPAIKQYPHWAVSEAQERDLRRRLYRELIAAGVKDADVVAWADEMLTLLRRAMP